MSQSTHVDVTFPSGEPRADRQLHDAIRRYLGRKEIVNTIQPSGFLAAIGFEFVADSMRYVFGAPLGTAAIERDRS